MVLCGGTINSPQLLELSGIGQPGVLEPLGIRVRHALPGVGENLQDHLTVNVQQGLRNARTFFEEAAPLALLGNILRWAIRREGLLVHPACQGGAFFRSSADATRRIRRSTSRRPPAARTPGAIWSRHLARLPQFAICARKAVAACTSVPRNPITRPLSAPTT